MTDKSPAKPTGDPRHPVTAEGAPEACISVPNGLAFNGEFRIGAITLGVVGNGIEIRRSYDGSKTEVAEALIEGVLEDAFFKRTIDADGNDRKGSATKP